MHIVELEKDPGLLELVDDAFEEACCHLDKVSLFRQRISLVYNGHVARYNVVIDEERDFGTEVELTFHILFTVRFFIHLGVVERVLDLTIASLVIAHVICFIGVKVSIFILLLVFTLNLGI